MDYNILISEFDIKVAQQTQSLNVSLNKVIREIRNITKENKKKGQPITKILNLIQKLRDKRLLHDFVPNVIEQLQNQNRIGEFDNLFVVVNIDCILSNIYISCDLWGFFLQFKKQLKKIKL